MKRSTYNEAIERLRSIRHTVTPETAPACMRYGRLLMRQCPELRQVMEVSDICDQIAMNNSLIMVSIDIPNEVTQ